MLLLLWDNFCKLNFYIIEVKRYGKATVLVDGLTFFNKSQTITKFAMVGIVI